MRGAVKGQGKIFDDSMVAEIRIHYKNGKTYRELAKMYYTNHSTISDIIHGYGAYRRSE